MKPTGGLCTSVSTPMLQQQQQQQQQQQATLSADQAYQLVGLLIVEGRVAHQSPKGRVEGPHATKTDAHTHDDHVCSHENTVCKTAERYSQQLSHIGQTLMPVTVEVLLLPECESGLQAINTDSALDSDVRESSVLLERWLIEAHHAKSREGALSLKMLMMAMRSYLGFSQLSAWYARSCGLQPKHVVYRVAVLDDSYEHRLANDSVACEYEHRAFPNVALADGLLLTVALSALKRQPEKPLLLCRRAACADCHKQPLSPTDNFSPLNTSAQSASSMSTTSDLYPSPSSTSELTVNVATGQSRDTLSLLAVSSAARRRLLFTDDNENFRDSNQLPRKSKLRDERKILFSDSSSNESLDRLEFRSGRDRRWPVTNNKLPSTPRSVAPALLSQTDRSPPPETSAIVQPISKQSVDDTAKATTKLRSLSVSESVEPAVAERVPRRRSSKSTSASKSSVRPPSDSSPAPLVRASTGRFDCVDRPLRRCGLSLPSPLAAGLSELADRSLASSESLAAEAQQAKPQERTAPTAACSSGYLVAQNLVVNFEESLLNGRISPSGVIDGFSVTLSAAGAQFSTPHASLPVAAEFFRLSDDNSPSPYLGRVELGALGKHGFRVPSQGVLQVTLFNPNSTVMKMFVVAYDLSAMPASSQTFLRQRTYYMPVKPPTERDSAPRRRSVSTTLPLPPDADVDHELPSYLRYVIHLRLQTSKRGHLHLHKDIRMIIARDTFEFDPQVARYELRSILEQPTNPTFSPIR